MKAAARSCSPRILVVRENLIQHPNRGKIFLSREFVSTFPIFIPLN